MSATAAISSPQPEACNGSPPALPPSALSTAPGPKLPPSEEMVTQFLPRIHKIARIMARRLPPQIPVDDLVSAGTMGLLDASRRYDPAVCDRFDAYAEHRIRGAMLDELRSHDSLSRELRAKCKQRDRVINRLENELGRAPSSSEVAEELGLDGEQYCRLMTKVHRGRVLSAEAVTRDGAGAAAFRDPDMPNPFQVTAARELRGHISRALAKLPERLKLVASLYYREGLTLSEIGETLGVTEARACQLRGEAVRRLQVTLKGWEVTDE